MEALLALLAEIVFKHTLDWDSCKPAMDSMGIICGLRWEACKDLVPQLIHWCCVGLADGLSRRMAADASAWSMAQDTPWKWDLQKEVLTLVPESDQGNDLLVNQID